MPKFQYSPEIIHDYPQVVGGVIIAKGMSNPSTSEALKALYAAEQEKVKARIGETPLSEIESLNAWRRAFSAFGVSPTQYRSAAEALLRRLTKKGDIPSINTLVDIGNLVSIRYALPIAIVDTREIEGAVTVHYSDGTESYTELGNEAVLHPDVGEVIFSDVNKMVIARRWCWRQSESSAANEQTTVAIITIEGHHDQAKADIQQAVNDLLDLLKTYAGGSYESAILTAEHPSI
ncbi:MAG: phenylalanine--tRNA ligase beta subunit-related protein [Chloroflexota bacterium]